MEVGVRVEAEDLASGKLTHTASGYLVYVAVRRRGRKWPRVPPLVPVTDEDRRRMAAAESRRKARAARRMAGQRDR